MLSNASITPTLPTTDITRAREFYEKKLGLTVKHESEEDIIFEARDGYKLYVYRRPPAPSQHTLASFHVEDLNAEMDELIAKGVVFEHYDMPGLKTDEKGVVQMGDIRGAWFKDPDGNILSLDEGKK
jgi:catechol 2,3-dioxygenase-like lactoylglutathione lyase family enzyme